MLQIEMLRGPMVPKCHMSDKQDLILEKHIKMQMRRQGGHLNLKHVRSQNGIHGGTISRRIQAHILERHDFKSLQAILKVEIGQKLLRHLDSTTDQCPGRCHQSH